MFSSRCIRGLNQRPKFMWKPICGVAIHARYLGLAGGQAKSAITACSYGQSQMQHSLGDGLPLERANEKGFDPIAEAEIATVETQKVETVIVSPTLFSWPLVSPPLQPLNGRSNF